ncbi:(d)CMP kinase [soil metagenome]
MKDIIVAIDGYSSCGKSTLARALAAKYHYAYVDSGAMYRAVTLFFLNNDVDYSDNEQVLRALDQITIGFKFNPETDTNETYLNGLNVEYAIRDMRVSQQVSEVSRLKDVREALVEFQQEMGEHRGIVMDGRDIGTVVFPDAELKLFMTADMEVRIQRRYKELLAKGEKITIEQVVENLSHRDLIDTTRKESPLRQAVDALVLDNTNFNPEEQLALASRWVEERMEAKQNRVV